MAAALEGGKWMPLSLWTTLLSLIALLGKGANPEDLSSSDPDLGHGMDPDG